MDITVYGMPTDNAQVCRIDEENRYTLTGETLADGILMMPENSCVEIKLLDV